MLDYNKMDYYNTLYVRLSLEIIRKIQQVQNLAARLLTGADYRDHISHTISVSRTSSNLIQPIKPKMIWAQAI